MLQALVLRVLRIYAALLLLRNQVCDVVVCEEVTRTFGGRVHRVHLLALNGGRADFVVTQVRLANVIVHMQASQRQDSVLLLDFLPVAPLFVRRDEGRRYIAER